MSHGIFWGLAARWAKQVTLPAAARIAGTITSTSTFPATTAPKPSTKGHDEWAGEISMPYTLLPIAGP